MTLLGSSVRLIFFITSKPPPSSSGTRSTSPSRQEPWHAVIEPPCSIETRAISRYASTQAAQLSSSHCISQMPMSISVR